MTSVRCACGRTYDTDTWQKCPDCGAPVPAGVAAAPPTFEPPSRIPVPQPQAAPLAKPPADVVAERLVEAQLATVDYIRSGLALFVMVLISSAAVSLGTQADFRQFLVCQGDTFCSGGGNGGAPYYAVGGLLSFIALIFALVFASSGAGHRKRARAPKGH